MLSNEVVLGQLLYIIPSICLYVIEIRVMFFGNHRYKFNKSSFNQIFFIYAVNNIIATVLYYFFFRMGSAPVFFGLFEILLGEHILLSILWQLLFHTSLATNLLDLVLSLNRFTEVVMPIRYKSFWSTNITRVVAFIIIFPYICFWHFPLEEVTMEHVNATGTYFMAMRRSPPIKWPSATGILGACVTVICIGCFFCNTYVGLRLHQTRNFLVDSKQQQEKIYFFFIMCVFVNQLLSCSTQVNFLKYF